MHLPLSEIAPFTEQRTVQLTEDARADGTPWVLVLCGVFSVVGVSVTEAGPLSEPPPLPGSISADSHLLPNLEMWKVDLSSFP